MEKPRKECREKDRLSELPESLILEIIKKLPLTDVVRTTVLSKHWENIWTTTPLLDFDKRWMKSNVRYREFVNGVLSRWRGTKILRFSIVIFDSEVVKSLSLSNDDVDRWVRFAVEKNVEEMGISLPCTRVNGVKNMYPAAQDVYSCSSLRQLMLAFCSIEIRGNVQWDGLKDLAIIGAVVDEETMDKVLRGSPRLEFLYLLSALDDNNGNLNISSSSLKRLTIDRSSSTVAEVRISTPNLEYLRLSGDGSSKCLLMNNMPSLSAVKLDLFKVPRNLVGERLTQILPLIKHVERVSLSDNCIEALGAKMEKCMLPSFPNAYYSKLKLLRCEEYEQIVGVLAMFPELGELVLETACKGPPEEAKSSFKLDKNAESLPDFFLLQLRKVEVRTCAKGDKSIIPLVQILLKYARNLEKMEFWEERHGGKRKLLLKMERSSPNEELMFDHTNLFLK